MGGLLVCVVHRSYKMGHGSGARIPKKSGDVCHFMLFNIVEFVSKM